MKHPGILIAEILLFLIVLLVSPVSCQEVMFHYDAGHTGDFNAAAGTIGNTVSLNWKYKTGGAVSSSPVVANGRVYLGSEDQKVYALNITTGKQLWNFTTKGPISSTPAVGNGVVYIGSTNLYALNSTTGRELWNFTADFPVDTEMALTNGTIYFQAGKTYALNASDGSLIWAFSPFDNLSRPPPSSLAFARGVIYNGFIDGKIYAFKCHDRFTNLEF
jgi:outer membrane protein assembly factor BamB